MKDEHKTKEQLINELVELRQRVAELEAADIERVRAEEMLRESEAHYRLLAENMTDIIWTMDMNLRFTYVSPSVTSLEGYSVDEAMALSLKDILTPASLEIAMKTFTEELVAEKTWQRGAFRSRVTELEQRHKDGSIIWTEVTTTLLRDPDGRPVGIMGVTHNITERKRAEEALELKVKQLATLSQASQAVTASLELDQVLAEIVSLAGEVVASDYTGVVMVDEAGHLGQSAENLPGVPAIEYRIRDEGLTSWIIRSCQAVIIEEIGEDGAMIPDLGEGAPRFANPLIVEAGVKSVAGLPLMVKGRLLGVLYIHSLRPGAFHGQLPLLTTFANQVAIAVENARLYEAERRRSAEFEALRQASLHLTSTLELQPILEAILDHALKLVAADDAHVFLYDGERLAFGAALWEDGRQQEPFAEPRPQGLTYTVARSGERIIIPDVNRHPLFRDYQWGGAVVGLPLRIGERVVGVMNVSFERPRAFDESELRVLGLLADQAAIAIENARLYEDVRRRAEEAAALLSTARAISSLELEAVLETIASQAKTLFKADGSRIHLLEPDGETLRCVVALHQRAEAVMAVSLKVGQGITGRVALSGLPEVVPNTLADPRSIQVPGTPVEAEAMALTPLKVRERVIGVMTVSRLGEDRPFTPPDLTFLTAFANQAAVVIENAHLYETVQQELAERQRAEEELRQRQLQLSVLNRMGRALAGTFELVRIYRIAYEHVAQLVDCPSFGISLYDPPTLTLRAEFMLDNGELIDAARFPPLVMDMEPTQGRVRAIATRQPEIITDYPSVAEKATVAAVRVGVSRDEHVTGAAMYVPMVARDQVIGLLEVQSYRLNAYGLEEAALLGPVANQIGLSIQNAQLYEEAQRELAERKRAEGELRRTLEKLREALGGIIQTVALAVETKDPYTAGHQRRVANLARAIANEMGLPQEQIDGVRMAGRIHDLGKIAIPAEILSTPIRLNDFQWGMIKAHSQVGYDILKTVEFPWPVAQIVLQHHERLDGSGYPQGLSGDEIMLEARILAVADVVEAMASFRPYRPTLGIDKALEEISQNRGILYDAEVVDACLKLFAEKGFKFE